MNSKSENSEISVAPIYLQSNSSHVPSPLEFDRMICQQWAHCSPESEGFHLNIKWKWNHEPWRHRLGMAKQRSVAGVYCRIRAQQQVLWGGFASDPGAHDKWGQLGLCLLPCTKPGPFGKVMRCRLEPLPLGPYPDFQQSRNNQQRPGSIVEKLYSC